MKRLTDGKRTLGRSLPTTNSPKTPRFTWRRMVGSLIEAAYPEGHEDSKLPQIRFIGVGPDPGQIISDVPTTEKLMAEESFTHSVS